MFSLLVNLIPILYVASALIDFFVYCNPVKQMKIPRLPNVVLFKKSNVTGAMRQQVFLSFLPVCKQQQQHYNLC